MASALKPCHSPESALSFYPLAPAMRSQATQYFSRSQKVACSSSFRVNSPHEPQSTAFNDQDPYDNLQFAEGLFDDKPQPHVAIPATNIMILICRWITALIRRSDHPEMEQTSITPSPLNLCHHGNPRVEFFVPHMGPNVTRRARTAPVCSDITTETKGNDNRGSCEGVESYFSALTYHFPIRKYPGVYCRLKDILERTIDDRPDDLVANNYVLDILTDSPALMNYTRTFLPPHPEDRAALKEKSKTLMILIDSILFDLG
ncbi:hypothetical protein GALMADRAFT_1343041 [Galerina marginata CBS 339.88]|uniref:Uncharacterized protein n=1 Tax=Galerina marginata (strain CBS 339.88) TaxID=685588 RepID=A0A067SR77_GALM3|nr:hypothetical protein GALMADRAFT_1343041 [Galerina marginata CBS 339.88]